MEVYCLLAKQHIRYHEILCTNRGCCCQSSCSWLVLNQNHQLGGNLTTLSCIPSRAECGSSLSTRGGGGFLYRGEDWGLLYLHTAQTFQGPCGQPVTHADPWRSHLQNPVSSSWTQTDKKDLMVNFKMLHKRWMWSTLPSPTDKLIAWKSILCNGISAWTELLQDQSVLFSWGHRTKLVIV